MCGSPTDKPLCLCLLKVDDIHQPNNALATEADAAASSSGWIERDNKAAIVAAFKPVLPLARSLAAPCRISKDPAHGIADLVEFLSRRRRKFEPTTRWNDTDVERRLI
jgi:hypothetical protein